MNRKVYLAVPFCALLILVFNLNPDIKVAKGTVSSDDQLVPDVDFVSGELIVTFSKGCEPSKNSVDFETYSFGNSDIDTPLSASGVYHLKKILPSYDRATSPAADFLERSYVIRFSPEIDARELRRTLYDTGCFENIDLNQILEISFYGTKQDIPTADEFEEQWNLHHTSRDSIDIDAPEAWVIERGNPNIIIGIIDTGTMIDTTSDEPSFEYLRHSDFNHHWITEEDSFSSGALNRYDLDGVDNNLDSVTDNVIGYRFSTAVPGDTLPENEFKRRFWSLPHNWINIKKTYNPLQFDFHGLMVGSIAAANWAGSNTIVGVANNCSVYNMVALVINTSEIVLAINHAAHVCDVINMSWGLPEPNDDIPDALIASIRSAATDSNCVLVAASGNEKMTTRISFPARDSTVLAVGAIDTLLSLSVWQEGPKDRGSNYGDLGDVAVVAVVDDGIWANKHNNCYPTPPCNLFNTVGNTTNGTSFAAPQAAGLAALIRSRFPLLDQEEVRNRIKASAEFYWDNTDLNKKKYGKGKINAYRALSEWGTISETTTWGGSRRPDTMYVSGDLTVDVGDTLIINKGVLVRVAPDHEGSGSDTSRVQIIVKGSLRIGDDGEQPGPVIFESFTDASSAVGDWIGIKFDSTSSGNLLDSLVIKHARVGIESYVPLTFSNCVIDSCDTTLVTTENLTLNNSTLYLGRDLVFADSVEVTLGSGTTLLADSSDVKCEFEGSLSINGSSINPVVMKSSNDGAGSQKAEWEGIYLTPNAEDVSIAYAIIKNAEIGIENRSLDSLVISNSRIEECEGGVLTYGGTLIKNTTITDVEDFGVYVAEGYTTLNTDTISYSDLYGVKVHPDTATDYSHASIDTCVFHDIDTHGAYSTSGLAGHSTVAINWCKYYDNYIGVTDGTNGFVTLENCSLYSNDYAYWVLSNDDGYVTNCEIHTNGTGIYAWDADIKIEADNLSYNTVGVYLYSSDALIKNLNVFNYNDEAIKCDNSSDAVVESTTVTYNDVGVVALSGSNPDVGHATGGNSTGHNIIHHNTPYHIENQDTTVTVMAENNMWRNALGPNPVAFYGSVDYAPWLTTPPDLSSPAGEPGEGEETAEQKYPVRYDLSSGYPNPFNPSVRLRFQVPPPGGVVKIRIYDVSGGLVRTVEDRPRGPGEYRAVWDGLDNRGNQVATGVYFVRMTAGSFVKTRKIVLIK